ncbi:RING_finger and CHY zinc finger domain-containing protein [Hexamita inflata]|uniref:RING finger and CHY zinc finger domain-containing protein n=1 Tax=Hexamita inflata TaxID=28002 RepID=A0AA86PEQ1_9EUKA|nr:RING finger and CHY zinc finger domain-containing protein [Hexamita inflata]
MKPVIQTYKNSNEVDECDRNNIVISVIFELKPGSKSKYEEEDQIILKEFVSDTISKEREQFVNDELKMVYHHMIKQYYDPNIDDYLCRMKFFEKSNEFETNWPERPLNDQIFIKYKTSTSVGCEHYVVGCDLQCPACEKFYTCRMCHEENEDHEFPRYEVTTVRCKYCRLVQPIGQYCKQCNVCFGQQYCQKCRLLCDMGTNQKPFYHCEKCGVCTIGYPEHNTHCDNCGQCVHNHQFEKHKCVKQADCCAVCLGQMQNSNYATIVLNCMHQIHFHCYKQLLTSNILKCPVCKKFLPVDDDYDWIFKWQKDLYENSFDMNPFEKIPVTCNQCQRSFYHPYRHYLYYCPFCKMYNCEITDASQEVISIEDMEMPKMIEFTVENVLKAIKTRFNIDDNELYFYNDPFIARISAELLNSGIKDYDKFLKKVQNLLTQQQIE